MQVLNTQNLKLISAAVYSTWLDEASKGLADIAAGRSSDARASILAIQARRHASPTRDTPPTESFTTK